MRKAAIFVALALLLALSATPALANGIPSLPHAFYGTVTVNGAPAADGTQISATVSSGTVITNVQNPTTTVGGSYGTNSPRLLVQGDIPNGATITFHVTNTNGTATGGTASFVAGGGPTSHDISVTIATPTPTPTPTTPGGGGGGGGGITPGSTSFFGGTGSFNINSSGIIQTAIEATSADGKLTINIPTGTKALDKDGNPLTSMIAEVFANPPSPPANSNIIGLAYFFGPAGATFDPPITFTWRYDPATLPAGIAEEDLVIAYYDYNTSSWIKVPCVVDTVNNKIIASVSHYSIFAMIGTLKPVAFTLSSLVVSPVQVAPGEKVDISLSVANTGGTAGNYTVVLNINGIKEAEKSVTVAAGSTQTVTFSVTKAQAGSYSVAVGGLSGSFTVVAPTTPPTTPSPTTPAPTTPTPTPPAPTPPAPTPPAKTSTPPPAPSTNWPLIGGIIGGVIVVALLIFLFVRRRD